jgi:hypothetical protein
LWVRGEYLLWWTKSLPLPPLLTTSPSGTPVGQAGVLGEPGTTVLFGGDSARNPRSGGRITVGAWLNPEQTVGVEGYFFGLENKSPEFSTTSVGLPILARPIFNAQTGNPDSVLIAFPNVVMGNADIRVTSTDLEGAGVDFRCNLCCCCCYRVDFLGGYRFLQLGESVEISETEIGAGSKSPVPVGTTIPVTDNFSTRNRFHGGELGVDGEWRHGCYYLDVLAKVALGGTRERVAINGTTLVNGGPPEFGGVLALPTNSGRFNTTQFAVVPELDVRLGYRFSDHLRAFLGYTFLYWSNMVRPGDEIDLTVNPTQFPPGNLVGAARPAFAFHQSDFWAQGLNFGVELRY